MDNNINVFAYFDYRKLLKDLYQKRKEEKKYYSYRVIGKKAGFSSAGFFSKILQGKVNISSRMVFKLADSFQFTKSETAFFELLVNFNQSKSHREKKEYFERIISIKRSKLKTLDVSQYELFSNWYNLAIREVLDFFMFKGDDFKKLGSMVTPGIKAHEAEQAIETLNKIGMIKKNPQGYYVRTDAIVSTGEDYQSLAINNFLLSTMDLAKDSIDRFSKQDRDISTLTLSVSKENLQTIKEKLKTVRRDILELTKKEFHTDRVIQINLQLFPMSNLDWKKK